MLAPLMRDHATSPRIAVARVDSHRNRRDTAWISCFRVLLPIRLDIQGRDGRHRVGAILVPLLLVAPAALGACDAPRRVAPCEPACAAREGDVQEFTALVDDLTRIGSHGAVDPGRAGR
jgi:hypothetical protein